MAPLRNFYLALSRKPLEYRLEAVNRTWEARANKAVAESDALYRSGDVSGAVTRMTTYLELAIKTQADLVSKSNDFTQLSLGWLRCHTTAAIQRCDVWTAFLFDDQAAEFLPLKNAVRRYGMSVDF